LALLLRRIKKHGIAQWTMGYVAVAYGIQHAVTYRRVAHALGLKPGESLVNSSTKNDRSYEAYLSARSLIRGPQFPEHQSGHEAPGAICRARSRFCTAWGPLGVAYVFMPRFHPVRESDAETARQSVENFLAKAKAAAAHALKLDTNNADGTQSQGDVARQTSWHKSR
jgi:hypothetical protein